MRFLTSTLVFIAIVAFLQWGVPALGVPPYILPTPASVLARLFDPTSDLLRHFGITALEAVGGFCLGSLVGVGLAVVFVHARAVEDALYPWAVISQTIPLVALAPLLVIWFGNGMLPRMAMSALFTFFPVLVNATQGIRQAEPAMLDLLHSYAVTRWQLFWVLRLPNSLPALFAGLKIGAILAVTGAIVGEFAGAAQGLGFVITVSTYHLDTDQTFAAVVVASLLGMGLYTALTYLERRVVFWKHTAAD
jgi:ABC-type nitrate/sulfonate/bicarbonate transport system permease component